MRRMTQSYSFLAEPDHFLACLRAGSSSLCHGTLAQEIDRHQEHACEGEGSVAAHCWCQELRWSSQACTRLSWQGFLAQGPAPLQGFGHCQLSASHGPDDARCWKSLMLRGSGCFWLHAPHCLVRVSGWMGLQGMGSCLPCAVPWREGCSCESAA